MNGTKKIFVPPIIQPAIAGIADFQFCQKMLDYNVGMATLGGLSIDEKSIEATKLLVKRGRKEFLLPKKKQEIMNWCNQNLKFQKTRKNQKIAVNVRMTEIDEVSKIWLTELNRNLDFIEINAHCQQKEITTIYGGQSLLTNLNKLENLLKNIKINFPTISFGLKVRGYIINDTRKLTEILEKFDCSYIHIDAMVPKKNKADLQLIKKFVQLTDIPIIGNNSIRTFRNVQEVLSLGTSAVSLARPLLKDPSIIKNLVVEYFGDN